MATDTYTWPSSWAMVKAALRPLSSTMEQLLSGSHTVPSSARPVRGRCKERERNEHAEDYSMARIHPTVLENSLIKNYHQ